MTADRWRELADADTVEKPLSTDDRAFLADFDGDEDVGRERALFEGIAELGEARDLREDDRARARATFENFRATRARRRPTTFVATGAVGLLAVAAAATLWLFQEPESTDLSPTTVTEARIAKGSFMLAGKQIAGGEAMPGGEWVEAKARSCVTMGTGRACFRPGSELRILDGVVELRSGLMEVEEGSVSLMGDEGVTELGAGEHHEIAATTISQTRPTPSPVPVPEEVEPVAEASDTEGAAHHKRKKSASKPAGQMLADARALGNKGKLGAAVSAYSALRRAYPGSAEARAANVSIGQLQLRRGRAGDALKAFDRYLKSGGSLAEEARWGRVRALDRLGKKTARDRAIDALAEAHPHSVYAAKARGLKSK
jgi:hypothetical protein